MAFGTAFGTAWVEATFPVLSVMEVTQGMAGEGEEAEFEEETGIQHSYPEVADSD
jgi:hypothetical protein